MKIKTDFVTNSSSTSFIFIFKGTNRTDLFRQLVKNEDSFTVDHTPWKKSTIKYDVWHLIECLISIIKKGSEDTFYLPDVQPITHFIDEFEREKKSYEDCLKYEEEERKKNKTDSHMSFDNIYREKISFHKTSIETLTKLIETGNIYSGVEVSFGNDGMICGDFGDAMEQVRFKKVDDELLVITENQH